jgi:hypothetical protein
VHLQLVKVNYSVVRTGIWLRLPLGHMAVVSKSGESHHSNLSSLSFSTSICLFNLEM